MKNKLIPYNSNLLPLAKQLRKQGILSEVLLWKKIKGKALIVEFHRQVPIDNFIVDFYCHEIQLAIEIDGSSHLFEEISTKDIIRQKKLEDLGVHFLRFDDLEVKRNIANVIFSIEKKIEILIDK